MPLSLKKAAKQALLFVRDMLAPFARFREVSVLCYHSVSDVPFDTNVTAVEFDAHLGFLKRHGSVFVSLGDIEAWRAGQRPLPQRAVALTFDDGYADFETAALPVLKKYSAPAAVFVVGNPESARAYLGKENTFLDSQAIGRLLGEPMVEVGYHSRTHPNLDGMEGEPLAAEVRAPFAAKYFAYPGGHYSAEAVRAVKAAGYAAAYSIKPTLVTQKSDPYLMPRNVISKNTKPWELRFATTKACAWYRAVWRLFV